MTGPLREKDEDKNFGAIMQQHLPNSLKFASNQIIQLGIWVNWMYLFISWKWKYSPIAEELDFVHSKSVNGA